MRLTVHLDTFDRLNPCAYVILWLDKESNTWSREGHVGLDLPESGALAVDTRDTLVYSPNSRRPLCVLEGLDLHRGTEGPFEGEVGRAQWCRDDGLPPAPGHWHVQCVDQEVTRSEHNALAADDSESCSRRR
ncbi:DUF3564 domain-containing protein [Paraburkholderia terrae]|uniref:DUF3564 family protein n=1 Tax=Paraburkholderia terrae TaxID=311230 RepID=UPI0030E54AED